MKAVRLEAVGKVAVRDLPTPTPGADELLVRVEAAGICGSDRHILHGTYPAAPPVTLGHEFAGIVVGAGSATHTPIGSRVTVNPNIACGSCRDCRVGRVHLCTNHTAIGVERDGGLAGLVSVPEKQAFVLPDDLPLTHGPFCEPLACCLHGLDLAGIVPGSSVAVLGGGVIGQLMVQLVRLAGATTVVFSTRQMARRRLAEQLGATVTIDPLSTDVVAAVTGAGGAAPGGVDVVLECAGSLETFAQSIAVARRGGTVVAFGVVAQGTSVSISPFDILVRELRIQGAFLNPLTHGRAAELVASRVLDLDALISRQIRLEEVPATLAAPPAVGEVKTIVLPA